MSEIQSQCLIVCLEIIQVNSKVSMKKSSEHNTLQQAKPTQVGRLAQMISKVGLCMPVVTLVVVVAFICS